MSRDEGIFARLKKIIRANIHDLIDKAQDPEKMLNQWVRDSWKVVRRAEKAFIDARGKAKELTYEMSELGEEAKSYHDGAALALTKVVDKTDDAKAVAEAEKVANAALEKELRIREKIDMREAEKAHYEGLSTRLEAYVERARERVEEGELEAERLKLQYRAATTESDVADMSADITSVDFNDARDDIKRRTRQKRAHAEVLTEIEVSDVDSKIDAYRREAKYSREEALEALKAEVGFKPGPKKETAGAKAK